MTISEQEQHRRRVRKLMAAQGLIPSAGGILTGIPSAMVADQVFKAQQESLPDRNFAATRVAGKDADPTHAALLAKATQRIDYSPNFGTELSGLDLTTLNSQEREELASFIAYRGVVFFRNQSKFDTNQHVALGESWGPLHIHPLILQTVEQPAVIVLDSRLNPTKEYNLNDSWHSDISFESAPASFSMLKFETIPLAGGDTIWADGYGIYDSLSPKMQQFLETLTATHTSDLFRTIHEKTGTKLYGKLNTSSHPVIRTNPVTGWKSLFTNSIFTSKINDLEKEESEMLLKYLNDLVAKRIEYQVRFRWEKDSVAIWDNRSTFHCGVGGFSPYIRSGRRTTNVGEVPYLDPNSGTQAAAWASRKQAIIAEQKAELQAQLEALGLDEEE